MNIIRKVLSGMAVSCATILISFPTSAAPTAATSGGFTSVQLDAGFLAALTSLSVAPAAISPGRIISRHNAVIAAFPITAGEADLGTVKAEIDHAGGLSLTGGGKVVQLTSFIIDLTGTAPVLTGLVTVNDSLLGRVPLFDLNLAQSNVSAKDQLLKVKNVAVTLTDKAAAALNGVFGITALARGFPIGIAAVRARLDSGNEHD
ncbi:MAG: hypothetical protein RL020_2032 [Pseudomonadota bacterium]